METDPSTEPAPSLSRLLQWGALFAGLILIGHYLRSLFIPLVFAFFLSMLVLPLCNRMERIGIGRVLSSLLAVILLTSFFFGALGYLSFQIQSLMEELPDLQMKLQEAYERSIERLESYIDRDIAGIFSLGNGSGLLRSGGAIFTGAISFTSSILSFFGILPIYIFLILLYRNSFKRFLKSFALGEQGRKGGMSAIERIKELSQGYLIGLLLVIAIIAVLNTTGLLILGIQLAIPLGIFSAILTIVPYIGVVIGAALPTLVAFLTEDSLLYPIGVIAVFAFVQFLEGNFITPRIVGSKVDINPLAAILGLIGGGMLWGIVGMILAIPMLGILKVLFEEVPDLRPFALLLNTNRN
jgi:predicted PurR-regulated permease PerM